MARRRRTASTNSSNQSPYNFLDMVGDGALVSALFMVLPFTPLRFENFVSEKHALLAMLAIVIVGVWGAKWIRGWRPDLKTFAKNPVFVGAVLVVITTIIATVFSLSPLASWLGKGRIPNGTLTHLIYFILMCQTIISLPRIRMVITPSLVLLAAVQFLWAIFTEDRSGANFIISTAGNPNYLSSWLLMAILLLAHDLFLHFTINDETSHKKHSRNTRNNRGYVLYILAITIFAIWMMFYAGGRGALVALIVAGAGILLMSGVAQHRFRLVAGAGIVLLALVLGVVTVATVAPSASDSFRVFRLTDTRRYDLWQGGVEVLSQINDPLPDYAGNTDPNTLLRPLVGYGPEMAYQLQSRWGTEGFFLTNIEWSFHNHLLDTLVEKGSLGLLAWFIMLGGVIYHLLREMQWLKTKQLPLFILLVIVVCVIATYAQLWLQPDETLQSVIALGVGLGIPGAIYLWILGRGIQQKREDPTPVELTSRQIFLIFATSVVLGHWIDLQFTFVQTVSEPLFWIVLGWIIYETRPMPEADEAREEENSPVLGLGNAWIVCTLFAGLHFANIYNNSFLLPVRPTTGEASILVMILMIVGALGFYLSHDDEPANWRALGAGLTMCGVLIVSGIALNNYLSANLGAMAIPSTLEVVPFIFVIQALGGILLVLLSFGLWVAFFWQRLDVNNPLAIATLVVCLLAGSAFYVLDFTSSATTRLAWAYLENPQPESYQKIEQIVEKTDPYLLASPDLYPSLQFMRLAYMEITTPTPEVQLRMDQTWLQILETQPYFPDAQYSWLITGQYEAYFGVPLPAPRP